MGDFGRHFKIASFNPSESMDLVGSEFSIEFSNEFNLVSILLSQWIWLEAGVGLYQGDEK